MRISLADKARNNLISELLRSRSKADTMRSRSDVMADTDSIIEENFLSPV